MPRATLERRYDIEQPPAQAATNGLALYEHMVTAIAECARVDEVKDIRDKAAALELYYRQAQNFEAEREAANVRLRAERRAGELLKELARATPTEIAAAGGHAKAASSNDATKQASPYASALESTGISRQTAHRYQALANVPVRVFEDALAGPDKASTNRVIARAAVRGVADPQPMVSDRTLWLWGRLRDFENQGYLKSGGDRRFPDLTDGMREDVLRLAPLVIGFLSSLEVADEHA